MQCLWIIHSFSKGHLSLLDNLGPETSTARLQQFRFWNIFNSWLVLNLHCWYDHGLWSLAPTCTCCFCLFGWGGRKRQFQHIASRILWFLSYWSFFFCEWFSAISSGWRSDSSPWSPTRESSNVFQFQPKDQLLSQVLDTVELVGCPQGGLLLPPYPRWPPTNTCTCSSLCYEQESVWCQCHLVASYLHLPTWQSSGVWWDKLDGGGTATVNFLIERIGCSVRWQVLATPGRPHSPSPGALSLPWPPGEPLPTCWKPVMVELLQWGDLMAHFPLLPSDRWDECME